MTAVARRILLLVIVLALAGCRQQQLSSADVRLEMSASDNRVGETTLLVRVSDRDGKPLSDPGALNLRGDMDHAGMTPVLAEAERALDGVFNVPFEWTMGGGWIVEARLTLPNGDVAVETFEFEILSQAAKADMDHSDMSDMDHGAMPGESSAVYLRVRNSGDSDATIVSASTSAAAEAAFHRTVVEGEMARMEAVDNLRIPAGETIHLAPGGRHIMLSGLAADLAPGSALTLRLESESGATYDLDFSVLNMLMGELDDAVEMDDLVFSQRWARPAQAGL